MKNKIGIEDILLIRPIRYLLLKRKFKSCGKGVVFASGSKIFDKRNISIGNNVKIGARCVLSGLGGITIGNNVSFAREVIIWSDNHNYYSPDLLPYDGEHIIAPVEIGDNVWIGARVCITPGVKIGEGAVLAMGAVITKDVPSGAVVAGNPAKVVKYRDMDKYETLKNKNKFFEFLSS